MIKDSLFSIVVPIYNSEEFLLDCIQSILSQTYTNLEIILIDDGSNDSSKHICLNLMATDNRIKYFYQENAGVSSARNYGIKQAKGNFISFIDSDDFIDDQYVETALKYMDDTTDMIVFGHYRYDGSKNTAKIVKHNFISKVYTSNEIKQIIIDDGRFNGFTIASACGVCFRLNLIKTNNLRFIENVKYNEDGLFTAEYVFHCSNNIVLKYTEALYYYRVNNSSATHQIVEYDYKYILSMNNILRQLSLYVTENNNVKEQIAFRKATKTLTKIISMIRSNLDYELIRCEMSRPDFRETIKKMTFSSLTLSFKVIYILLILKLYKMIYWVILYKNKNR